MDKQEISTLMSGLPGYVLDELIYAVQNPEHAELPKSRKQMSKIAINFFLEKRCLDDMTEEWLKSARKEYIGTIASGIKKHSRIPEEFIEALQPWPAKLYLFAGLNNEIQLTEEQLSALKNYGIASYFILEGLRSLNKKTEIIRKNNPNMADKSLVLPLEKEVRATYLSKEEIDNRLFYVEQVYPDRLVTLSRHAKGD